MQTVLGKPACPFSVKNPLTPSAKRKRRFLESRSNLDIRRGGGFCRRTVSGLFVEKVGAKNFSINFIGTGFIDG